MDQVPEAFVFAPDPMLTVTVEAGADGDEIHIHAGGQGFWISRMLASLGVPVVLCGPFGGEIGRVVRMLMGDEQLAIRTVKTVGSNGAYIHDRRQGERVPVAEAVARVRGTSVNALIVDSLAAEIDRVRADEDFTARAPTTGPRSGIA